MPQNSSFSLRCYRWKRWGFWPQATIEIYDREAELWLETGGGESYVRRSLYLLRLGMEMGATEAIARPQPTGRWNHNLREGRSNAE